MIVNANILDINIENKGKYKLATLDYKDLTSGKAQSKKVMSFGASEKAFAWIASNSEYRGAASLTLEKVGEYWNITDISAGAPGAGGVKPAQVADTPAGRGAVVSDDKRQLLIVRQSSLERAIQFFELTKNTKVSPNDVVSLAESFKTYVFDGLEASAQAAFNADDEDVPL